MTNPHHVRTLLKSIAALGVSGLLAPAAFAATYTLTPNDGSSAQDWNTAATWGGAGTPGAAAGDVAAVSGEFGGVSQSVDIAAPLASPLTTLVLGDTTGTGTTTVGSANSTALTMAATGASITSGGGVGAVNVISAPISLAGGLVINGPGSSVISSSNNNLLISGKITPTAASGRTIENLSTKQVTFGDIDLSTAASTATMTIRAGTTSAATSAGSHIVLGGTIANGSSVASNLILGARYAAIVAGSYAGSHIQIDGTNTYTGTTALGLQSNTNTLFRINSDQPFGPASGGTLTIGSNAAANTLEAVGQARTITKNSVTINRPIVFQGDYSMNIAATTLNMSNNPTNTPAVGISSFIHNNITAEGASVTLGSEGGNIYLNASNTGDLYRMRSVAGAGTTIIASNIADNSGASVPADSRMVIQQDGTGTLILTGANTYQGSTRITGTGTIQLGNGGATGSLAPAQDTDLRNIGVDSVAIVNGTGTGTLAFNRSADYAPSLTANGAIGIAQKGSGVVTLSNAQFNSGANSVGDGTHASTLVVNGGRIDSVSTTSGANITSFANSQLAVNTVTLTGGDTASTLNLKVGQPVYVTGSPSAVAYVDTILSETTFRVGGLQTSSSVGALAAGTGVSLTFGEGSALGTSAAVTTVNNLGTLAGTGVIAGSVNAIAGSFIAPGALSGDVSTLSTGALSLTGATLAFDISDTAAGISDRIVSSGEVTFSALKFSFDSAGSGVLETGAAYNLVSGTSFVGDVNLITTVFGGALQNQYVPTYSVSGGTMLSVTFTAVPEPAGVGLLMGMATLGGCLMRRRRQARA